MARTSKIFLFIVIGALILLRFIYLDQDAPAYMIGGICQEDEQYYTLGGISRYNADNDRLVPGFEKVKGEGLMLSGTPLTYLGMKIFGNNYWGFRLGVVLVSLFTILLLYDILRRLKIDKKLMIVMILYLFTDFYFFLFSRFQTPQIYSILAITIVLWLYFKLGIDNASGAFLISFFIVCAICFIYIYNAFLAIAFGTLVCFAAWQKKTWKLLLWFAFGGIVGFLFYALVLLVIDSSIMEIYHLVTLHGGGIEKGEIIKNETSFLTLLKNIIARLLQLPMTNLFRYNLAILFLFLFPFVFIAIKAFRQKSEKHLMYVLFLLAFVFQTCFVMSYPFKKLIVILPFVAIVIADALPASLSFYASMSFRKKMGILFFSICIIGLCFFNYKLNNAKAYWEGFNYGYYENTSAIFNVLNIFVLLISVGVIFLKVFSVKINYLLALAMPSLFGIILIIKYCILSKSFYSKEGFSKASALLDRKGVIMNACYAAQFYTSCKPGLGCYGDLFVLGPKRYYEIGDSLFKENIAQFTIQKAMPSDQLFLRDSSTFTEVMVIPMKYYAFHIYKYSGAENR